MKPVAATAVNAFGRDGFLILEDVLDPARCADMAEHVSCIAQDAPGTRSLLADAHCAALARLLAAHPVIATLLPPEAVAVQCTFFEKSAKVNWRVPIHQDRSIAVAARVDHPHVGGWAVKEGVTYVQPPVEVLERLVAVRLHLDPCGSEDGPLRVVPGSHARGVIDPASARHASPDALSCPIRRGGVLVMRPLLLHASSKGGGSSRRRVLHFLYGPPQLPCGLRWHYVA